MDKTTIVIIVVAVIVAITVLFRFLIKAEEKKNDPTLAEPRDSDTRPGNQGVKHTREK